MTTLIISLSVTAYAVAVLFAARYLYGVMRARIIDGWTYTYTGPIEGFNKDRGMYAVLAFLIAAAWPLTLAGLAVYWFMTTTPVRSQHEIKQERDAMAKRISDLERDLKL
ncbi:hypothetical protein [Streptomyces sp. NPDC059009]|uniref:hypothetical protein n=1 Tax=Streptomyces sp. NPDC059009 TaxID=3346694 RepID=UPI0036B7900F